MKKLLYVMENLFKIETNNGNVYQFCNHLKKNNYDVTFLTTKSEDNKNITTIGDVPVIINESKQFLGRELTFPKDYLLENKDNIDIVWCYLSRLSSFYCARFASKYKKKLIIKCDSVINYIGKNPIKKLWKYLTITYPLKKADLIIAETQRVYDNIVKINKNIIIIPNAVKISDLPILKDSIKEKTILSIGRVEPIKGINNLLIAFNEVHKKFPEWKLKIIGPLNNQEYVNRLKENIKTLNIIDYVEFTGPKYGNELYEEMNRGSIYIIASNPLGDGFNNTLPYTMYYGCTPVITDVGDIKSVLINNNKTFGYICSNNSSIEISNKIIEAINNPINPKDLKRHISIHYEWSILLDNLLNKINQII